MSRILITISTFFVSILCFSQADTTNLKNWNIYDVPIDSDTLTHYNWSHNDWIVYSKGNNVHAKLMGQMPFVNELPFKIEPSDEQEKYKMRGKRSVVKVVDGYLVAFWRGEFGGYLYWFSDNGITRKLISPAMIVQFLKRDNKIYAIEGLAHMSISEGSIVEIKKVNDSWTTSEYLTLPFAPYAARLDTKNNFIIVTSDDLLSVDINRNVDTLVKEGFWPGLYPTSMVIQNDICYIGMRQGVLKFDLLKRRQKWLVPK
jgi:hypothetical protein